MLVRLAHPNTSTTERCCTSFENLGLVGQGGQLPAAETNETDLRTLATG